MTDNRQRALLEIAKDLRDHANTYGILNVAMAAAEAFELLAQPEEEPRCVCGDGAVGGYEGYREECPVHGKEPEPKDDIYRCPIHKPTINTCYECNAGIIRQRDALLAALKEAKGIANLAAFDTAGTRRRNPDSGPALEHREFNRIYKLLDAAIQQVEEAK